MTHQGLLARPNVPALLRLAVLLLSTSENQLQLAWCCRMTHQGLLARPSVPALAVSSARLGAAPKSTTTSYLPPGHSIVAATPFWETLNVVVLQAVRKSINP
jgi:hypothetical protein